MLFSVEQALVGRDEKRAPLKTPAWEARSTLGFDGFHVCSNTAINCPRVRKNLNPVSRENVTIKH